MPLCRLTYTFYNMHMFFILTKHNKMTQALVLKELCCKLNMAKMNTINFFLNNVKHMNLYSLSLKKKE